jgi:hypothetical protein
MNAGRDRLLALNIRATRIGYVLFEGPERLLDWGTRTIPRGNGLTRVASLIALTSPSEIVICQARRKRDVDARDAFRIAALVRREAALRSIPFTFAGVKDLQEVLLALRAANKYEMAAVAARTYPEILWKLPPSRKRWQTEPRVMLVFDALVSGLAYWRKHNPQVPTSSEGNVMTFP